MPQPLAYLSGRFLPASEAALSIFDLGVVSGVTVTDFCRTYRHRLFRHAAHVGRFWQGREGEFFGRGTHDTVCKQGFSATSADSWETG